METRNNLHNFQLLEGVKPTLTTSERVKFVIMFGWGSVRKLAREIGISHSALNSCISHPGKYQEACSKIIAALGFDPWESR